MYPILHGALSALLLIPQSSLMAMITGAAILTSTFVDPTQGDISSSSSTSALPIMEIIKVYGKIAGPECYGKIAPKGSSCQVTKGDVDRVFGKQDSSGLSVEDFQRSLEEADFQWPLKPYGIDKSLSKTATMNKGAETKVFMDELEARGLYDRRNPAGPLPTSLRPQLNRQLQSEEIDPSVVRQVYEVLRGNLKSPVSKITLKELESIFHAEQGTPMDYYGFLELIGKETISWPY